MLTIPRTPTDPSCIADSLCQFLHFCTQASLPDYNATPNSPQIQAMVGLLRQRNNDDVTAAMREWCGFWNEQATNILSGQPPLSTTTVLNRCQAALILHCADTDKAGENSVVASFASEFERSVYVFLRNVCDYEPSSEIMPALAAKARVLVSKLMARYGTHETARGKLPVLWAAAKATPFDFDPHHKDAEVRWLRSFYQEHAAAQVAAPIIGVDWAKWESTEVKSLGVLEAHVHDFLRRNIETARVKDRWLSGDPVFTMAMELIRHLRGFWPPDEASKEALASLWKVASADVYSDKVEAETTLPPHATESVMLLRRIYREYNPQQTAPAGVVSTPKVWELPVNVKALKIFLISGGKLPPGCLRQHFTPATHRESLQTLMKEVQEHVSFLTRESNNPPRSTRNLSTQGLRHLLDVLDLLAQNTPEYDKE